MKKILLSVFATILSASAFCQYEGFENWTTTSILTLDDYNSGAIDAASWGIITTYPSADSYIGSKSIKMETFLTPSNDTVFGYFYTGDPNNMTPGQAISLTDVDSIVGYYKSNLLPNDSAIVLCEIFKSSASQGGGTFYLKGIQSTWKRFAFPINATMADSMLLAIAGGNPLAGFQGIPGSWLMVDNLQLKAANGAMAPILNHSFENWSTVTLEQATNWQTFNTNAVGAPLMPAVKSTDFYSGAFAMELNTILYQGDTLQGFATNGTTGNNGLEGGQPFSSIPVGVELYYKYAPVNNDFAFASFQFKKNGVLIGNIGTGFNAAANYTNWNSPISITMPDTVLIVLGAGSNPGSKLKIDAIDFLLSIGQTEYVNVEQVVSYPNPVADKLNIKFTLKSDNEVTIRLIDVAGKELAKKYLGELNSGPYYESFNTSEFSSGVYFVEFMLGNEKVVNKFIVK